MAAGSSGNYLMLDSRILDQLGALHPGTKPKDPILVVVQQGGGNDGLNTVVPYTSSQYYDMRPTLAIAPDQALALDDRTALHPNLTGIKQIWDAGNVAVVQGVGYPNPDLSHFQSTLVWQTADLMGLSDTGWLARYLDTALHATSNPLKAVAIGDSLPAAFRSPHSATPALQSLPDFQLNTDSAGAARRHALDAFRRMNSGSEPIRTYAAIRRAQRTTLDAIGKLQSVPSGYTSQVPYPATDLAKQLQLVAQLINANLGTRVFWVEQDGYDDHSHEAGDHAQLLKELDGAVSAFYGDLRARGWERNVLIMTWSEFGRRVEENDDHGTDHGTAGPMLLLGGSVKGGIYGDDPVLSNLDANGNLIYGVDYRSVYGTVLARWMNADPAPVVGGKFETIPFV
jgi:uncharacterized protein (DUF1501 family)